MNRAVFASLAILCLLSVSSTAGFIRVVKADSGTVYIRADGSVDPSTAPISTIDNVTYTLTGDITSDADGIVIERDNVVLDGAGYTVLGISRHYWIAGVNLTGRSNDTVENLNVKEFLFGIKLLVCYVGNNSIVGNNITNNVNGIYCETVYNDNRISGNNITNNSGNGIWFWHASNNSIIGNNIKANECGGVYLMSSQYNTISENNIADNGIGIEAGWEKFDPIHSLRNRIYKNNFVNNSVQAGGFGWEPNVWDDGYPSGGNYWSDYSTRYSNAAEIDHSGLWNTPYVIDISNKDNYPLMPTYGVTIDAHCNIEDTSVAVPIIEDVSATGYTTPHTFNSLRGSHTFAVPNTDTSDHLFLQWSTGQTSTAITVSSAGTYTAYYSRSILRSDLDGNNAVNILDLSIAAQAFRSKPGDPNWNPAADLDNNGIINILDITIVARDFGTKV
jgi:parallel beta-helix repeat protein